MGASRIMRILQRVVNVKGGSLKVDGRIGKNTIAQAKKYKPEPDRLRAYRVKYYADLCTRKPKLEKILFWLVQKSTCSLNILFVTYH